jgi:hypothetical protein
MISVPGTINIAERHGRFGTFNVGTLECSIGSFTVKDSSIEEFEPGIYHGDFVIEKIKPLSYLAGSRLVVEVRATLSAILLSGDSEPLPNDYESLERDPIEEDSEQATLSNAQFTHPRARASSSYRPRQRAQDYSGHSAPNSQEFMPHSDQSGEASFYAGQNAIDANSFETPFLPDAANLFGVLWPIGRVVKLDPTIDRGLFRQQKDYLKNNGYRFSATEQNWVREG